MSGDEEPSAAAELRRWPALAARRRRPARRSGLPAAEGLPGLRRRGRVRPASHLPAMRRWDPRRL